MSDTPSNDPPSSPPPPPPDPQRPWVYSDGISGAGSAHSPADYYSDPARAGESASTPPPPSPPPPPTYVPAARPAAVPRASEESTAPKPAELASVIDTIEAIIIALIIALTFRAYIVEAFVIPTGSMAPTLLGAHFKVVCPKCGYVFDRDARLTTQWEGGQLANMGDRPELHSNTTVPLDEVTCPNCHYVIPPSALPEYLPDESRERVDSAHRPIPFAWANNGDRILVLKYIYSIMEPERWDVIVFKEPEKARDNYIKRLIGRPGETIEIVGGDIFISPPGQTSEESRVIARKPDFVQAAVWQLIYDNDFYPTDEGMPRKAPSTQAGGFGLVEVSPWTNPWTGDGWSHGRIMSYAGAAPSTLHFNTMPPYAINILGYNNDEGEANQASPVGDMRVEALWTPGDSAKSLKVTLGRPRNCYRVTWDSAGLQLEQFDADAQVFRKAIGATIVSPPPAAPVANHPYKIAMSNVDHVVQFSIDGQNVLSHVSPFNVKEAKAQEAAEAQEGFGQQADLRRATDAKIDIEVGGASTLAHLRLLRDLYYCQSDATRPKTANEGNPLTLHDDEFFAMGDNSRKSLDGRMWANVFPALDDLGTRPGIVPRRYLLGKAFFVYWPAGFRASTTIPWIKDTPIVPNFGDMRFIR